MIRVTTQLVAVTPVLIGTWTNGTTTRSGQFCNKKSTFTRVAKLCPHRHTLLKPPIAAMLPVAGALPPFRPSTPLKIAWNPHLP